MSYKEVLRQGILAVGLGALVLSGCGSAETNADADNGDHDHGGETEAPPDHACEHAQNGPFVPSDGSALTAGGSATDELPEVKFGEWTTVQLRPNGDGAYYGYIAFHAKEAVDHRFFTSAKWAGEDSKTTDNPYIFVTHAGGSSDPTFAAKHPVGDDPGCVEVNFNHFFQGFEADADYTVEITQYPEETLSLVVVPAGKGDDHDHDHDHGNE